MLRTCSRSVTSACQPRRAPSRAATRRAVRRSGVASIAKRGRPAPPCAAQRRNRSIYIICEDSEHRPTQAHGRAIRAPLPPELAFRFSAIERAGAVELHFSIADGYILYREPFAFTVARGSA